MGRNKRKMKLQSKKPLSNKSNKKYSSSVFNDKVLLSNCDGVNTDDLENVNIEPALLNHIKNIRNVDERVLIWNRCDEVDTCANERLHSCLNVDMVIKSMRGSPFAGYLRNQIDQLNKASRASLSGVVMKQLDMDSKLNFDTSNVIDSTETVNNTAIITEPHISPLSTKEMLNCSTENNDGNISISTVSTNKTEPLNLSPVNNVRSSGRATKKNYLDMLLTPTALYKKSSDDNNEKSKRQNNVENVESGKNGSRKLKKMRRTRPVENVEKKKETKNERVRIDVTDTDKKEEGIEPFKEVNEFNEKVNVQGEGENSSKVDEDKREGDKDGIIKRNEQGTQCISCEDIVTTLSPFSNKCVSCSPGVLEVMRWIKNDLDLVCVADPTCWSQESLATNQCSACIIQRYMSHDCLWNKQFTSFANLTVESVRSSEMVARAKESILLKGQRLFNSRPDIAPGSCVLNDEEPLSTSCQWSLYTFLETNVHEQGCDICKQIYPTLYCILPTKEHFVCHQCLLRAHYTIKKEAQPCTETSPCDHCHLITCQALFPIEVLHYRYTRIGDAPACRVCLRDEQSLLIDLPSGARLCLLCIWRIRIRVMSVIIGPCCTRMCDTPGQCGSCLIDLIRHVTTSNTREIVTYQTSSFISRTNKAISSRNHANKKLSKKRQHTPSKITKNDSQPRPRKKRRNSLEINAVWATLDSATNTREKRIVKPTRFNDYFVGDNSITQLINRRKFTASVRVYPPEVVKNKDDEPHNDRLYNEDDHEVLDLGDNITVTDAAKNIPKTNERSSQKISYSRKVTAQKMKMKTKLKEEGKKREEKEERLTKIVDNAPRHRRIKQAMVETEVEHMIPVRQGGPRVKQVSRMGVSCLDLNRQKCIVKAVNRSTKPDDQIDGEDQEAIKSEKSPLLQTMTDMVLPAPDIKTEEEDRLTQLDQRDTCGADTDVTTLFEYHDCDTGDNVNDNRHPVDNNSIHTAIEDMVVGGVVHDDEDKIIDNDSGIINYDNNTARNNNQSLQQTHHRLAELDVYRDSDNEDDVASEEENIDPDLDSVNTVKNELITTSLAHEGGYPIVTTRNAMPNKVMCYSCGSGGDQMIHCVSCAEPFHFFCIEFQFRPKSKEMFVCRNCTQCHTCNQYGSDLKCIKCQLGFHPACVDKYPPSRSEDRSNWACYKCAMCLHCGMKAGDAMEGLSKDSKQIDWGKDPWQCGRCSRSRKEGHVCPECGRAYQEGLETVKCEQCTCLVHRQCVGLNEDEYEVHRFALESSRENGEENVVTYNCRKCDDIGVEGSSGSLRRRTSLQRQCKDTSIKAYCDKQLTKRMADYISKTEAKEEQLLEEHNLSGVSQVVQHESLLQMDGVNDDEDDVDEQGIQCGVGSPITECISSNAMCNSSESVEEYDLDQLTTTSVDLDEESAALLAQAAYTKAKIGIFSRLVAEDFLTPRHMIMEALARITIKLSRYPPHTSMPNLYHHSLLTYMRSLSMTLFPWLDYEQCVYTVHDYIRRNSSRQKLVIKALSDLVRDGLQREMEVFSSSVWDIEEKLHQSLIRGRDEFIIYHSEQHLTALMKTLENSTEDTHSQDVCKYTLAVVKEGENGTICEKDVRKCALCRYGGDDGLEGRLIYGSKDIWVHVNCALWSDEVYEKEDGALVNVNAAIERGRKTTCSKCHLPGATVHCSANCQNCYHFNCAFNQLTDPVFTESRTFYCSEQLHDKSRGQMQLGLADMLILRRIYLPICDVQTKTLSYQSSDNIVITIGNLRIDRLGKLRPYSDTSKTYLCPIDYHARRLFWSMSELDSLVMYTMNIKDEINRNVSATITASIPSVVPQKALSFPLKKRRMIDTSDSRHAKRTRPLECRQEIVYEMDDLGNLQPISKSAKTRVPSLQSQPTLSLDTGISKVNRRFPKDVRVNRTVIEDTPPPPPSVEAPPPNMKTTTKPYFIVTKQALPKPAVPHAVHHNCQPPIPRSINNFTYSTVQSRLAPPPPTIIRVPTVKVLNPPTNPFFNRLIKTSTNSHINRIINPELNHSSNRIMNNLSNPSNSRPFNISSNPPINRLMNTSVNHPINNLINPPNNASTKPPSNILRVTKLTAVNSVQSRPLNENPASVLRTALTMQPGHQGDNASLTKCVISSSGSLVRTFPQYDGEADDWSLVDDSVSSLGSDHETVASIVSKAQKNAQKSSKIYTEYGRLLKYTIEGFTSNRSPKSAWTYLVRRVSQMRTVQGFTEYPLRSDGWSKFGIDHRHVIFIIEQMIGAYNCHQYDFKYNKATIIKLREQCTTQSVGLFCGARSMPWVNDQPEHIVRDPLAFLRCKSNLCPKNHAPDQCDVNGEQEPDNDYIQKLAMQFRELKSGVLARVRNVLVCVSDIHGRGLFARREFSPHEIIIEYVGETDRKSTRLNSSH